jgi:pilus assembly protein CpaC
MIAARTTQFWRSRQRSRRPAAFFAALVVYIIVILVAAPQAQPPQAFTPNGTASPAVREPVAADIDLLVGRSTLLNVGSPIARVSLTVPDIADAMVTSPTQLLIHGKQPGTISLFVWDKSGAIKTYEVNVRRDLSALKEQLKQLFPGEDITVLGSGKDVVLSGTVASQYVVEKAAAVAGGYTDKKDGVVNLLKQQEGVASNQVMLRVRFAEVSRSAMQELGASFVANGYKGEWFGRTATQQFPAPEWDEQGRLVFSDFLNLFLLNTKEGLGGVVRALQNKGLFQSLAEPNLIASNGKEASFLAGGEFPFPIIQPAGTGGSSVTIQFKEFGIRLNFTPTVLGGDLIHLKVRPEVSALDFSNAVFLEGFRIPALSTRRTETEVELRDGQTFAIAGLLNNTLTSSMSKIPGIGDIPILGLLFRSKAHQKNQTELVVMITPTIIRRGQTGVSEGIPSLVAPYLGRPDKTYPNPDAYTGSPRYPANQGTPRNDGNYNKETPAPAPAPAPTQGSGPTRPMPSRSVPQAPTSAPISQSPTIPASTPQAPSSMPTTIPASPSSPAGSGSPSSSSPASMPVVSLPGPTVAASPGSAPTSTTPPPPMSREQIRALERAREQERRISEAEARQRAAGQQRQAQADEQRSLEQAKKDAEEQKQLDAEKRQADKLAKERARREAEIARKNGEIARKKAEEDQKREKALAEAATRLKEAQAVYQMELEKAKSGKGNRQ